MRIPRCGSEGANKTCSNTGGIINRETQNYTPNSGTFLDSAFFSPETVLPTSYLLGTSEPEDVKPKTPKAARRIEIVEERAHRSSHWVGLVASVSVGMVIAFFLFPIISIVTRSTQSYVTNSWESEINRRVGQYEQINTSQGNAVPNAELLPYNLAASSWQELQPEISGLPAYVSFHEAGGAVPHDSRSGLSPIEKIFAAIAVQSPPLSQVLRSESPFPLYSEASPPVAADMNALADSMLLVTPGPEQLVRLAFGQNILLRDGRVFFRVPPEGKSPKQ